MANPLSQLDEAGDAVRKVIRAYHGSPYDFDRFDASKIGTGEGAQAYGHGLYFAGEEGVAQYYRTKLAGQAPFESPDQVAAEYLKVWGTPSSADWSSHKSPALALDKLRKHAADPGSYGYDASQGKMLREAAELISSGAHITPKERTGRMYEVAIQHPEESLLDYDSMAETQSPQVQQALRTLGFDAEPGLPPLQAAQCKGDYGQAWRLRRSSPCCIGPAGRRSPWGQIPRRRFARLVSGHPQLRHVPRHRRLYPHPAQVRNDGTHCRWRNCRRMMYTGTHEAHHPR